MGEFVGEIYMTKAGYEKKMAEFNQVKALLKETSKNKIMAAYDGSGDTWHDNFTYEQLDLQEEGLIERLNGYQEILSNVVIIEKEDLEKNMVNIGDKVLVQIIYDDGESENLELILDDASHDEHAVTLSSPLGKVLYKAKINESYDYEVGNVKNKVVIQKIIEKAPSS